MNQLSNYFFYTFTSIFSLFLLNSLVTSGKSKPITRCDQLPKVLSDFSLVLKYSPFHVYRSLDPTFNCTTGLGTGPLDGTSYGGTFVILQQNAVKTIFGVFPQTNISAMTAFCDNGVKQTYNFLVFNVSAVVGYVCPYFCSADGSTLADLRCYGHNADDEKQIQNALNQYQNVPGFKNISNTQLNCNYGFTCSGYFL